MTFTMKGYRIKLDSAEVQSCKRLVGKWMKNVDELSSRIGQPTYFFTFLIIMNLLSQEALDSLDPKRLSEVMAAYEEYRRELRHASQQVQVHGSEA